MVNVKRNLLNAFYKVGGFRPFHLGVRDKLLILMYHRFSDSDHPSRVSVEQLRSHLQYLNKHASPMSLREGLESLEAGKVLPTNPVAITIDDGYRDAYEIALPVLNEFGYKATLFAVTDFIDRKCWIWTDLMRYVLGEAEVGSPRTIETDAGMFRISDGNGSLDAERINGQLKEIPNALKEKVIQQIAEGLKIEIPARPTSDFEALTWEQIIEMDSTNIEIESHSVTHPILTQVEETELDDQLVRSKLRLEEKLGREVDYFCYPNGNVNQSVKDAAARAGYKGAVTTEFGFNGKDFDPFLINRIYAPQQVQDFAQCVSGFESLKQKARQGLG